MNRRPSFRFATHVLRGPPIRDKDGQPTAKRAPIRTRENQAQAVVQRQAAQELGRPLTKRERRRAKKLAAVLLSQAPAGGKP